MKQINVAGVASTSQSPNFDAGMHGAITQSMLSMQPEIAASTLFAVAVPAICFYLAENVCPPGTQNMVGCKEFLRSRRQAMGGDVRKADGGPKTSDL